MGKERAIIFLGTAIASLALVLGMITVLPTTTDLQATSSGVTLGGHFSLTVADPDGTIVHYVQMDNFATDAFKTGIVNSISGAGTGLGTALFIALCNGNDAVDDFALAGCSSEFSNSGRCDATASAAAATAPASSNGGPSNAATSVLTCTVTINVAEGNQLITNLSINTAQPSDQLDAMAISVVTTPVTVFGNQVVTATFTINANNA